MTPEDVIRALQAQIDALEKENAELRRIQSEMTRKLHRDLFEEYP